MKYGFGSHRVNSWSGLLEGYSLERFWRCHRNKLNERKALDRQRDDKTSAKHRLEGMRYESSQTPTSDFTERWTVQKTTREMSKDTVRFENKMDTPVHKRCFVLQQTIMQEYNIFRVEQKRMFKWQKNNNDQKIMKLSL